MEKYLERGREIFDAYCSSEKKHPVMLPRAPEQTYIDVYRSSDEPGTSFRDDILQQSNYEAEVKLYRALEKLKQCIIVLHNFEYTHHQYRLCDSSHVRKGCSKCGKKNAANKEGECDFLIIGEGYFVIMEVKNMTHVGEVIKCESEFHLCTIDEGMLEPGCDKEQQLRALNGTFKKSLQQRTKITQLINCIAEGMTILQFTAYPNFNKMFRHEFQAPEDKISSIVFDEDIDNFRDWWEENVGSSVSASPLDSEELAKYQKIRDMLLAVWCTDKDKYDKTKCSLGRCVRDIDDRLRSGQFTFRRTNPGVVPAPSIVKHYLGLDNLTKQQSDILQSEERLLWINGPAGAGKTIILLAKIIQLVKSNEDARVVFFVRTGWEDTQLRIKKRHYQRTLENADIRCVIIGTNNSFHTTAVVSQEIEKNMQENQVVIVHSMSIVLESVSWITDVIGLLNDCDVFVDDMQCFMGLDTNEGHFEFLKLLLHISFAGHYVWVGCDIIQSSTYLFNIRIINLLNFLSPAQHVNLSMNLRNSSNLSKTLSIIRNKLLIKLESERSDFVQYICALEQSPGHYIHGPKTVIHVLYFFDNIASIGALITEEIDRLCQEDILKISDIGFLLGFHHYEEKVYLEEIINSRSNNRDCKIKLAGPSSCYSSEWPAVITILQLTESSQQVDLMRLYVSIARARACCSIILYPEVGKTLDDYKEIVSVLVELKKHSKINLHTEQFSTVDH